MKRAIGDVVNGPGSGTSDSIAVWMSDGEGVVTAAAMSRIGKSGLDAINTGAVVHSAACFATGGVVGRAAAASTGGSGSSDANVSVVVNTNSGGGNGFSKQDATWLQNQAQGLVDQRINMKVAGQDGFLWKTKNGHL